MGKAAVNGGSILLASWSTINLFLQDKRAKRSSNKASGAYIFHRCDFHEQLISPNEGSVLEGVEVTLGPWGVNFNHFEWYDMHLM